MRVEDAIKEFEDLRVVDDTTTPSYKQRVRDLYFEVTGKSLRDCNCKNIYNDALVEIYAKLKTPNKRIMSGSKARLVKGVVLQHEGNHYTNANLTDEVARAFLEKFPMREDWFEIMPEKAAETATESEKAPEKATAPKAKKTARKRK